MKNALKRKNVYLDEGKIRRAQRILGTQTEAETIDRALDLIVFRKEILRSLESTTEKVGEERTRNMAKHLIDSDIYIDFLQSGGFHSEIARIYAEHTPGVYFSSVVIEELLAGTTSPSERRNVETLYTPFERARRVVTPTQANWKETGNLLAQLFQEQPSSRSKLPSLVADCLIALSARTIGATVYTRNRGDFELLQRFRHFYPCHLALKEKRNALPQLRTR